jgi:uncharacterized repeat protein (TIGR03803 family)
MVDSGSQGRKGPNKFETMATVGRPHLKTKSNWRLALATGLVSALITTQSAQAAEVITSLHPFDGSDGEYPGRGALIQGTDGNFYGVTQSGGVNAAGTVFNVTPGGTLTTLYNFCSEGTSPDCTDGLSPLDRLIQGADRNFYGVTAGGGAALGGTIFKITPSGGLTTFYNFCSQPDCADGDAPEGRVIQGADGNFLGQLSPVGATTTARFSKSPPAAR